MTVPLSTPEAARLGQCPAEMPRSTESERGLEPALANLLDHLACELAQEYVRLMEEAATKESLSAREEGPKP